MSRIIYYHGIHANYPDISFAHPGFSLRDFRTQIRLLSRRYKFITMQEALARRAHGDSMKRLLCVTTDDGLRDNLAFAEEIQRYNGRLTLFLNTSVLDEDTLMWRHKINYLARNCPKSQQLELVRHINEQFPGTQKAEWKGSLTDWSWQWPIAQKDALADALWTASGLPPVSDYIADQKPYLTWREINQLVAAGHDVGAHTISHPDCSRLTWNELRHEVIGCMHRLQAKIGRRIATFTYPFGRRPRPEFEQRLQAENPDLKILMGIAPRLNTDWLQEREDMEAPTFRAFINFMLKPLYRTLTR